MGPGQLAVSVRAVAPGPWDLRATEGYFVGMGGSTVFPQAPCSLRSRAGISPGRPTTGATLGFCRPALDGYRVAGGADRGPSQVLAEQPDELGWAEASALPVCALAAHLLVEGATVVSTGPDMADLVRGLHPSGADACLGTLGLGASALECVRPGGRFLTTVRRLWPAPEVAGELRLLDIRAVTGDRDQALVKVSLELGGLVPEHSAGQDRRGVDIPDHAFEAPLESYGFAEAAQDLEARLA